MNPLAARVKLPSRRDPAVARIVRSWRRLTSSEMERRGIAGPGSATLVACSGGADSSALVLALRAATDKIVVAHVVHDLRGREEALADRDAARELAEQLGLEFTEAEVSVRDEVAGARETAGGGTRNAEAVARRLRYAALARLATERGLGYVATAHHADDQLESVLMGLVRGAGPRGLRGMAERRTLGGGGGGAGKVRLVRPMLDVARADCERLCRDAGWEWREDATNADESRLRAAIRLRVAPELKRLRPGVERRASRSAELMRDAAGMVDSRATRLVVRARGVKDSEGRTIGLAWGRERLGDERAAVVGAVLRRSAAVLQSGHGESGKGADRLGRGALERVVRAVRDTATRARRFELHGVDVTVTVRRVEVMRKEER